MSTRTRAQGVSTRTRAQGVSTRTRAQGVSTRTRAQGVSTRTSAVKRVCERSRSTDPHRPTREAVCEAAQARADLHVEELQARLISLGELHYEPERDLVQHHALLVDVAQLEQRSDDLHAQDHPPDDVVDGGEHVQAAARHLCKRRTVRVRRDRLDQQLEAARLHERARGRRWEERADGMAHLHEHALVVAVRLEPGQSELHAARVGEDFP